MEVMVSALREMEECKGTGSKDQLKAIATKIFWQSIVHNENDAVECHKQLAMLFGFFTVKLAPDYKGI